MYNRTRKAFKESLNSIGIADKDCPKVINSYVNVDDETLLSCLDAFDKAGVASLPYLRKIISNKVLENKIRTARERKMYGSIPKEFY